MNNRFTSLRRALLAAALVTAASFAAQAQTGSVGIGTTAPNASAALDVVSSAKGALLPRMTASQRGLIASPATGLIVFQTDGTPGFYYNSGTPAAPVWQQIATAAGAAVTASNGLTKTGNNIALGGTALSAATDVPLAGNNLTFSGPGNVGIGTSTPGATLQVERGTATDGTARFSGTARNSHINYSTAEDTYIRGGKATSNVYLNDNGGNVGIGTTAPTARLTVKGPGYANPATSGTAQSAGLFARLSDATNLVLDLGGNGGNGAWLQSTDATNLAATYPLLLNPNGGNVGIGTTTPTQTLDVNGSTRLRGLTTAGLVTTDASGNLSSVAQPATAATAAALTAVDKRQVAPADHATQRVTAGFGTYANTTGTTPFADFLHLRSYLDVSGGNDNLLMFNKSGLGVRLYQQAYGSTTAYSTYKDVLLADNGATAGYLPRYTSGGTTVSVGQSAVFQDGTGNVGVGTASPYSRLSFGGTVYANAPAGRLAIFEAGNQEFYGLGLVQNPSSTYGLGLWGGSGGGAPYNGSTGVLPHLYLGNTSNVGIGTITPAQRLDVTGGSIKISTAGQGLIFPDGTTQTTAAGAIVGDIKQGLQTADHAGWVKLDGRGISTLTATQQANATALGIGTNLPDATGKVLKQTSGSLLSVAGAEAVTIYQGNLPSIYLSGYTNNAGRHNHGLSSNVQESYPTFGYGTASGGIGYTTQLRDTTSPTYDAGQHAHSVYLPLGGLDSPLNIVNPYLSVNQFLYLGQ